jgi:ABC-type transport system substrate-binding protein
LNYSTYPVQAEAIQQMMNAVGFQVTIVPYLASAAAQLVFVQKKFPAATTGFAPATSGPLSIFEQCCSATGNFNLSKLTLPDVQPLLDQMSTLSKPSASLLQKATKLVMQGAYFIPLSFQNSVLIYGTHVHNVVFAPSYANSGDFLESPFIYVSKN